MPTAPDTAPPLDSFPTPPSAVQPPDIEDTPPTMPADDPFKDNPPQPPGPSEPEAPRSELQSAPADNSLSQQTVNPGWRVTAKECNALRNTSAAKSVANDEPALLPEGIGADRDAPIQLPTSGSQKQNPLRLTSVPRASQVVRAAHWAADEAKAAVEEAVRRCNPLRSN